MGVGLRWLLIAVVFVLAIIDSIFMIVLTKPSLISTAINSAKELAFNAAHWFGVTKPGTGVATPVKPQPLTLPVAAYVIGPPQFINELTDLGAPASMIRPVNLSELSALPTDSIIIIDWDYVNGTMHESLNQLSNQLQTLISRKDLIILYTKNPKQTQALEEAIAIAWGNYYHSTVIGYPVIGVGNVSATYIVGFGGYGLEINVIPQYEYVTNTLNELITNWYSITHNTHNPISGMDPTNMDPCEYLINQYGDQLNGQYGWLFYTGPTKYEDIAGNEFEYDYCTLVINVSPTQAATPQFPVDYLGYANYIPSSSGGSFAYYNVGINMTEAYEVDQANGYNSYMGWGGESGVAQPSNTGCSLFSYSTLEMALEILQQTLEFIFDAATSDGQVAGLTSSLAIINNPSNLYLSDLVWNIGVTTSLCTSATTTAGAQYPVGFEVDAADGIWFLNAGVGSTNTAASPILWTSGTVRYPNYVNGGYYVDSFESTIYFVLQYNPSTSYTVTLQSTNDNWLPFILYQAENTCPG
ncbi:hypothetical protein GCM10007112_20860 [Vulcanisaeta souniana JCM 11219]|nr:hypothetical protein GCM10007112_20860 [Vulcanisaeta souniana JCM 11219]